MSEIGRAVGLFDCGSQGQGSCHLKDIAGSFNQLELPPPRTTLDISVSEALTRGD